MPGVLRINRRDEERLASGEIRSRNYDCRRETMEQRQRRPASLSKAMLHLQALSRRELVQNLRCLRGFLLGKKVPPLHGLPLYIVSPPPPDSQRAAILFVESIEWPADGPQMKHRARDASRFCPIRVVMLDIQGCRRAVLLADRM